MRTVIVVLSILLPALPAAAQRYKYEPDTTTSEGRLLRMADMESDSAVRITDYEQFLATSAKHAGAIYAWIQVQPLYLKAQMFDKVIAAGEAILAGDPLNAPAGYNALQACEQKKDAACITDWSNRTVEAAKKEIASKKPDDATEAESWTQEVDFAKQVTVRCEYSLFNASAQSTDPNSRVALGEALEKLNPESQYMGQTAMLAFVSLLQLKDNAKAADVAERAADRNQANEQMLLVAADSNLSVKKNYDKAVAYTSKITEALPNQPPPQGVAPADWETQKKTLLGRAYWMLSAAQAAKTNWLECEKAMTAALPYLEGSPAGKDLMPGANFYLGLANYSLAKASPKPDRARRAAALKYFNACAASPGPFQEQAKMNIRVMAAGK